MLISQFETYLQSERSELIEAESIECNEDQDAFISKEVSTKQNIPYQDLS